MHNNIQIHDSHVKDQWKVTLADTGSSSMTGARLKKIEPYIETDNFMMTYGDGVANIDLAEVVGISCLTQKDCNHNRCKTPFTIW